jgi:hypothetical protein
VNRSSGSISFITLRVSPVQFRNDDGIHGAGIR